MRSRLVVMAVVAVVLLVGCSEEKGMQPTITGAQALARAERLAAQSLAALPAGATFKRGVNGSIPCDSPTDNGPEGRVFAETRYEVDYPPGWPAKDAQATLTAYWSAQRYKIKVAADDALLTQIIATDPDGYQVALSVYHRDGGRVGLEVIADSPCVWENGTPDPE